MPVVIKELVITATVDAAPEPAADQPAGGAAPAQPADQALLVEACVAQVLAVLREQAER
jgi:hypothetical protein